MNLDNDYDIVEAFQLLPCARWFLAAYTRDVYRRLPSVKATITSTFSEVLKIDSTKKILRKLAAENRNSANWQTNVGDEYGAILQSVLLLATPLQMCHRQRCCTLTKIAAMKMVRQNIKSYSVPGETWKFDWTYGISWEDSPVDVLLSHTHRTDHSWHAYLQQSSNGTGKILQNWCKQKEMS